MRKFLTIGWGVPLVPSMLRVYAEHFGCTLVSPFPLQEGLSPLSTFELDGEEAALDRLFDFLGCERQDKNAA